MTGQGGTLDLLVLILKGAPRLPGAACRADPVLFDAADGGRIAEAVALCRRCPQLVPCRDWADSRPKRSLIGVVGGRYRGGRMVTDDDERRTETSDDRD